MERVLGTASLRVQGHWPPVTPSLPSSLMTKRKRAGLQWVGQLGPQQRAPFGCGCGQLSPRHCPGTMASALALTSACFCHPRSRDLVAAYGPRWLARAALQAKLLLLANTVQEGLLPRRTSGNQSNSPDLSPHPLGTNLSCHSAERT